MKIWSALLHRATIKKLIPVLFYSTKKLQQHVTNHVFADTTHIVATCNATWICFHNSLYYRTSRDDMTGNSPGAIPLVGVLV